MTLGPLLIPALRWDSTQGFSHLRRRIDEALTAGVGGFVLFGGSRDAAAELTADLHARSGVPLLIAADAERGAGQQFAGCMALPPLGALGFLDDPAQMRRAGQITARDLKRIGVNWALSPAADLDGALLAEWIDGCQSEGVMACAKHFDGRDLAPFRAPIDAGVASIMAAQDVPSAPMLAELLRERMEFEGLIVCDALDTHDTLNVEPARDAVERRERWALWARPGAGRETSLDDEIWSRQAADSSVHVLRGTMPRLGSAVEIVIVDDDPSGSSPAPGRAHFASALRALEIEANVIEIGSPGTRVPVLIAAFCDAASDKSAAGFSAAAQARIARVAVTASEQKRESLLVLFSHPRNAAQFGGVKNILCAWGGDQPMQAAAARVIARG